MRRPLDLEVEARRVLRLRFCRGARGRRRLPLHAPPIWYGAVVVWGAFPSILAILAAFAETE